nr:uncharacterized protein LOC119178339 isoform X2 [Rhipicephalus microplus]
MANVTKRAFGTLSALILVLAEVLGEGKDPSGSSVVDAFKIFRTFPHGTTIFDIDGDGDLDCVTAVRTEFNEDPLETTYVLLFKGLGGREPRNISFHIKPGRTPDRTQFTVDDECVLWTTQDTFHEMPEDCMLEYGKSCKDAVKPYDEEICAEFVP